MSGYIKGTSPGAEADAIRAAFGRAIAAIEASYEPTAAFRDATMLGQLFRQMASETADFRAQLAARLYSENNLSLAELALALDMSRARAAQLVHAGRTEGSAVTDPGTTPSPPPSLPPSSLTMVKCSSSAGMTGSPRGRSRLARCCQVKAR